MKNFSLGICLGLFFTPVLTINPAKTEDLMQDYSSRENASWDNAKYELITKNTRGEKLVIRYYLDKKGNLYEFRKAPGLNLGPTKIGNLKEKKYTEGNTCFFGTNYQCLSNITRTTYQYAEKEGKLIEFSRTDYLKTNTKGDVKKEVLGYAFGKYKIVYGYVGEKKDGKYEGNGTYTWKSGDKYIGQWENNNMEGKGTYIYSSKGHKFVGNFKNGVRHGYGVFSYANGDKYEGNYINDSASGDGTYSYKNGAKYVGNFKNGKRDGEGTYFYEGGAKYVGNFKNGKRDGKGTYIDTDGKRYRYVCVQGDCKEKKFPW